MTNILNDNFRSIVPIIKTLLPRHILENESYLITFLEAYYEWLELTNNPTDVINKAANIQFISSSIDDFFEEFRNEYMINIPSDILSNKENLIKNIRDMYRAKGTEKAIKFLFRILYNEEIDISYPSEKLLKPSDGIWVTKSYMRIQYTNPNIYDLLNRKIYSKFSDVTLTSSATSIFNVNDILSVIGPGNQVVGSTKIYSINSTKLELIDTIGIIKSGYILRNSSNVDRIIETVINKDSNAIVEDIILINTNVYELTLSNITRKFYPNNTAKTNDDLAEIILNVLPIIGSYKIINKGSGYDVGTEIPVINNYDGTGFLAKIKTVKTLISKPPGEFFFYPEATFPVNSLRYESNKTEKISDYFRLNSKIIINNNKFTIINIDEENSIISINSNLDGTENLTEIYRSYDGDTKGILDISIINPGYGYTTPPLIDLSSIGNGDAIVEFNIDGSFTTNGYFQNDRGFLDSTMKLQDGKVYQEFSYIIRSGQDILSYKNILKNTVHPAGLYFSGEVVITTTQPSVSMNVIDGHISKILLKVVLEPESSGLINYDILKIQPFDLLEILPYDLLTIGADIESDLDINDNWRHVLVKTHGTHWKLEIQPFNKFGDVITIDQYANEEILPYANVEIQTLMYENGSVSPYECHVEII